MANIEEIIDQLHLFSLEMLTWEAPVNTTKIDDFENSLQLKLPLDYKKFLSYSNGINLMGTLVYGIGCDPAGSLEGNYIFEHKEVGNPMYPYLIPFSPDGGGNHYCFDVRTISDLFCDIVFWQHNYKYSENDMPEITHRSFADWMKEVLIDWTLEEYDYYGNEIR